MSMRLFLPLVLIFAAAAVIIKWPGSIPGLANAFKGASPDLVGTWTCSDGPIRNIYSLNADGTCSFAVSLPSNIPQQAPKHGKWSVENGSTLHITFDRAASPTSSILPDAADESSLPINKDGDVITLGGTDSRTRFTRQ